MEYLMPLHYNSGSTKHVSLLRYTYSACLKFGSDWGCYYVLFEKKILRLLVHCHIDAPSQAGRRLNDIVTHYIAGDVLNLL
jgi:hypothetical protein